jgi:uncharacterized membrane protein
MSFDEIHPLIIHFPIALLSSGFLFDFLSFLLKKKSLEFAGWWNLILGIVSALCAIVTGLIADYSSKPSFMDEPFPIHTNHGSLQILASCVFVALLFWRGRLQGTLPKKPKMVLLYFSITGIAVTILFYGSHLGAVFAGRY